MIYYKIFNNLVAIIVQTEKIDKNKYLSFITNQQHEYNIKPKINIINYITYLWLQVKRMKYIKLYTCTHT